MSLTALALMLAALNVSPGTGEMTAAMDDERLAAIASYLRVEVLPGGQPALMLKPGVSALAKIGPTDYPRENKYGPEKCLEPEDPVSADLRRTSVADGMMRPPEKGGTPSQRSD